MKYSGIGGQAVIEGIMMQNGENSDAVAIFIIYIKMSVNRTLCMERSH